MTVDEFLADFDRLLVRLARVRPMLAEVVRRPEMHFELFLDMGTAAEELADLLACMPDPPQR
ncbi:MAG TPA: hypothetical protein VFA63_12590 [Pseudonocardiaceae bacterium]|nr:hypothetical protein [Pseudonocardiaceae bacterium]